MTSVKGKMTDIGMTLEVQLTTDSVIEYSPYNRPNEKPLLSGEPERLWHQPEGDGFRLL